jgi:hypothetical protein
MTRLYSTRIPNLLTGNVTGESEALIIIYTEYFFLFVSKIPIARTGVRLFIQ